MTKIYQTTRTRAKLLRSNATQAERKLWFVLRDLRPQGYRFRRQAPIGPYIADFACHQSKTVVEVDGAIHSTTAEIKHDARRTQFLKGQGFVVLRFTNEHVLQQSDSNGIVQTLLRLNGAAI
ncbi:MAG: endonuclease domain-containing protein [Pseudomonadota bacterium]